MSNFSFSSIFCAQKKTTHYIKPALIAMSLSAGMLSVNSASAKSTEFYNCAVTTGCIKLESKTPTSDYNATTYPIVMAHGFFGWSRLGGVVDYFYGIPQTLNDNGATVFATKTASVNSTEARGEQLLAQLNTILAITGDEKANVFGHSHGGMDSRYVAAVAPNKVASVTTVASPHKGSGFADYLVTALDVAEGNPGQDKLINKIIVKLLEFVGKGMDIGSGIPLDKIYEQNGFGSANALTKEGAKAFNDKFPAPIPSERCGQTPENYVVNNVAYYSFSGNKPVTNTLDPSDYLLGVTSLTFEDKKNDGLVTSCSSRLGYVVRDDYKLNHLDTVNHLFGISNWFEANPLSIYRSQVNRLKNQGY